MSWVGCYVWVLSVVKLCWVSCGDDPDPIFLFLGDSSRRKVLWGPWSFWMPGCPQYGAIVKIMPLCVIVADSTAQRSPTLREAPAPITRGVEQAIRWSILPSEATSSRTTMRY